MLNTKLNFISYFLTKKISVNCERRYHKRDNFECVPTKSENYEMVQKWNKCATKKNVCVMILTRPYTYHFFTFSR